MEHTRFYGSVPSCRQIAPHSHLFHFCEFNKGFTFAALWEAGDTASNPLAYSHMYYAGKCFLENASDIMRLNPYAVTEYASDILLSVALNPDWFEKASAVLYDTSGRKLMLIHSGNGLIAGIQKKTCQYVPLAGSPRQTVRSNEAAKIIDANQLESIIICNSGAGKYLFDSYGSPESEVLDGLILRDPEKLYGFLEDQLPLEESAFLFLEL